MRALKNSFIIVWCFVLTAFSQNKAPAFKNGMIQLITKDSVYTSGDNIILKFKNNYEKNLQLYCSHSYGSTLLKGTKKNDTLTVIIPKFISQKTGKVHWKLLSKKNNLTGDFRIISKNVPASIETYIGPPSVKAGTFGFSMVSVIPTDDMDNPLDDNNTVYMKYEFINKKSYDTISTKNSVAFTRIYAQPQEGRVLISSKCNGFNSKEYDISITPSDALDFEIFVNRIHKYADGNQITNFTTSVIKDEYGNVVSDGTYVEFYITTQSGTILKTNGTTINGIATAKIIHPDHKSHWEIIAKIVGIAKSNSITLDYEKAVHDFNVVFSSNNRTITIGPIKSFMNQMIPDGLYVKLLVYENDTLINQFVEESKNGYATFRIDPVSVKKGSYNLEVKLAGIVKQFEPIEL